MQRRAYRFRMYPTPSQTRAMDTILLRCRTLYNAALEQRETAYRMVARHQVTAVDQMRELPGLKDAMPEFREIDAQVLQDVVKRLDKNFRRFFEGREAGRRAGHPRFKGRHRYNSFTYPQLRPRGGFKFTNGKLDLRGIGKVRTIVHRRVEGAMKTCSVKRDVDRWYAVIVAETPDSPLPKREPSNPVGIDLGLPDLVTTSNGTKVGNPRYLAKAEGRIKECQRELSRKARGSKNRRKVRARLAKAHRKVRDQRSDFHHKLSRALVERHDGIFVENLNIEGLVMSGRLSRSIADAGWDGLVSKLEYKAASAGIPFARVPPGGTSQDCSSCDRAVPKPLSERTHRCGCGAVLDRDVNAARNVLRRGLERLAEEHAVGREPPELTPAEMQASTAHEGRVPASWKQEPSEKDTTRVGWQLT